MFSKSFIAVLTFFIFSNINTFAQDEISRIISKLHSKDSSLMVPDFLKISKESPIKYNIIFDSVGVETNLLDETYSGSYLSPFLSVESKSNGEKILSDLNPDERFKDLYYDGEKFFADKNYEDALANYHKILAIDSTWFKTYTNIGDCYFMQKDYKKAEEYFLKALSLNSAGYQEYFFLSDTYTYMYQFDKAFINMAKAFMFNRKSKNVKFGMDRIAKILKYTYDDKRLVFPVKIEKLSDNECNVKIHDSTGIYVGLAMCMAVWEMEPEFQKYLVDNPGNGDIKKFKSFLLAIAYNYLVFENDKKKFNPKAEIIYNLVFNQYTEAIVLWDILSSKYKTVVYLLPDELQDKILEYITHYCYKPIN